MRKLLPILMGCVLACMLFVFAGCNYDPSEPPGSGTEQPENPDPKPTPEPESDSIEGFNLAKTPATINIVTDSGEPIAGDPRNQPYFDCTVSVENGREGEDFTGERGKVRVRGNNTAGYDKKSFRLKFDQKVNLLGLNDGMKFKNWVLLACYKDVSFLRDAVMFELGKQSLAENGYYASDYGYAEVTINGQYNGFYMVAEQQQVNKNRVNIDEPDEGYTGNDIGYFIEYDGNAPMTEEVGSYFRIRYKNSNDPEYDFPILCEDGTTRYPEQWENMGAAFYTVKNDFYAPSQVEFIKNYVEKAFKIVYDAVQKNEYTKFDEEYSEIVAAEYTDSRSTVEAVVDIDALVDSYIIAEVACDNDLDFSSWFFTVDMSENGSKKIVFHAPWDSDSGFGMMNGLERLDDIFAANSRTNAAKALNPWTSVFFKADWFKQAVAERWAELKSKGAFDRTIELIDKVTSAYKSYFDKNYEKWDNLGKIVDPVQSDTLKTFRSHADAAEYLKNWLSHRIEFLTEYFGAI